MRKSGILLPVFSLPSPYGIGCFSEEALRWIDFLADTGQAYWQILPLGPTGYGNSPYQSFSVFAGNPYLIDPGQLYKAGLLTESEYQDSLYTGDPETVDYEWLYRCRLQLLKCACRRASLDDDPDYKHFLEENADWLPDYGLFVGIKNLQGGRSWNEWPAPLKKRDPQIIARYKEKCQDDIALYSFIQYVFEKQWLAVKAYANGKSIKIIGDIPIYAAFDSADAWAHPELFQIDEEGHPLAVAGVPPDGFSATGQVWGNPLYDWDYHRLHGFTWWKRRMQKCFSLCDVIRIDHFRGFDEYFSIPEGSLSAADGIWKKGPGIALFHAIGDAAGEKSIIAEDLGYMTDTVRQLVKDTGYPGMKVFQFAFDSRDSSNAADYLPENYPENCVVYTGTHDNDTTAGWMHAILPEELDQAARYIGLDPEHEPVTETTFVRAFINTAMESRAKLCIIPMQDYLELGSEARINIPSTHSGNWEWRLDADTLKDQELIRRIRELTVKTGRS